MSTDPYRSLLNHLANCHDSADIDMLLNALLTDKEQIHDVSALLTTHKQDS